MCPNKGILSYHSFTSHHKLIVGGLLLGFFFPLSALLLQFKEAASQRLTVYLSIKYLGVRRDDKLDWSVSIDGLEQKKKGQGRLSPSSVVSDPSACAMKCCICSIVRLFLASFSLPLSAG